MKTKQYKKAKVEKKKKVRKLDYSKEVEPFASTVHHFIERRIKSQEKVRNGKENPTERRMASKD